LLDPTLVCQNFGRPAVDGWRAQGILASFRFLR
jgi:hypothetical protein